MAFNGEIYEIFSWLSPPLLHQISRQSNPCSQFLSEIPFIQKQCQNSLLKPQEYLLIQDDSALQTKAQYLQLCPLGSDDNNNHNYYRYSSMIPRKEFKDLQQNSRVVASSNGLLLCQTSHFPRPTRYFLCNPATRNLMYVESPSHQDMSNVNASSLVMFLCGNSKKFPLDYTLLLFNPLPTWSNYCNVYALEGGQNNWELKKENLVIGPGNVDFQNPVHCTDGLYFMSDAGFIRPPDDYAYRDCIPYYVLHYDIQRGTSRIVALPDEARTNKDDDHVKMGIFGWEKSNYNSCFRSICLVKIKFCEIVSIWSLDVGRGSKLSSWREWFVMKKSVVRDLGIKGFKSWQPSFGIIEKKLVMVAGKYVYSYCLEGKEQRKARRVLKINDEVGGSYRFGSYTSTLRPCTNQT